MLWGTLDMMVLFAPDLMKDSRTAPARLPAGRLVLAAATASWCAARSTPCADLKGKTVVYAQNSPSQYFVNNLLLNAGIQPSSVKHKFTATAFEAAAAFVADKSIDACVSWAPDIYNIPEKVKGTRILTTTAEANKLIADVWAVRADFAKDHPEVVKGLVAGIFEGMDRLKDADPARAGVPVDGRGLRHAGRRGAQTMANDAHSTNFAENKAVLPERERPRPTSSAPGRTSPSSTASWGSSTRRPASTR